MRPVNLGSGTAEGDRIVELCMSLVKLKLHGGKIQCPLFDPRWFVLIIHWRIVMSFESLY